VEVASAGAVGGEARPSDMPKSATTAVDANADPVHADRAHVDRAENHLAEN
jgi:hypothetical protein